MQNGFRENNRCPECNSPALPGSIFCGNFCKFTSEVIPEKEDYLILQINRILFRLKQVVNSYDSGSDIPKSQRLYKYPTFEHDITYHDNQYHGDHYDG